MRNVWIIASREFRQYFISPIAYALATMLYLILGGIFFINVYFGLETGQITPDGRIVIGAMVTILLFATPAITMRLLADEYRMGTMELLLTAPVRDWELVVGKWLGAFGFMSVVLAVTWVYPLILHRMTSPGIDQGTLVAAYVGLLLMVAAMLAIGVFISALFRSPVAAFFVSLGVMLALWIVGSLASSSGTMGQLAGYLSFVDHYYNNFYLGVLDLGDAVYFLSLTALALFLGAQVVEARRWR
ncbi:MAG: ABC transporter permease subunit [Chloroflexi bacterium]|jgi:ABC-2 type transport system permease protein|nr:ABC transporter permease subunit [Chloroflexota bacterium]